MDKQSDDEGHILALIHSNRIAFWTNDLPAYERCFVHAPHTTRWSCSRPGGIFVLRGWEEIAQRVEHQFAGRALANDALAYQTTVENLVLRVEGHMAWATYDQRYPQNPEGINESYITHEVRFFEKEDDVWRIAFLGFLDDHHDRADIAFLRLAADGTIIGQGSVAAAALAADEDLVVRAGRLRIRDRNADQKLQAAIRWAADLGSALFAVRRRGALPIVLSAGEGLPTKVWWVIAESGMIWFSMGDQDLVDHRLDGAAVVYGLSPAQKRVASYVVGGMALDEIASTMEITPNTARTHLQRVFEKTGVRSQPALVRVLLSAVAPI
jgi:DNA-binding CsgD family transcriptional regulator